MPDIHQQHSIHHSENSDKPENKKLVLFGAGKVGRSFIGQLFSRSGFEVVFIDINRNLLELLNHAGSYKVVIKSEKGDEIQEITNIRGVHLDETARVAKELSEASVAAVSVGKTGLSAAIPVLAEGLVLRRKRYGDLPLDIIIAENMRNADLYLSAELRSHLPPEYPLDELAGFVETSLGKMVPLMSQKDLEEDPLQVFAEPYNTLIVAKNGFRNPIPEVVGMEPKENIKAWVDRKLFIHNLGHAAAAYLGFRKNPRAIYLYEVLEDPEVFMLTKQTMLQSAGILTALYPGEFSDTQLEEHINDLLGRFRNKALGDTLFRVGCDLRRKLSTEDRVVAPIKAALSLNKPCSLILETLKAALNFRAKDENGNFFPSDDSFFKEVEKGTGYLLEHICGLPSDILDNNFINLPDNHQKSN